MLVQYKNVPIFVLLKISNVSFEKLTLCLQLARHVPNFLYKQMGRTEIILLYTEIYGNCDPLWLHTPDSTFIFTANLYLYELPTSPYVIIICFFLL